MNGDQLATFPVSSSVYLRWPLFMPNRKSAAVLQIISSLEICDLTSESRSVLMEARFTKRGQWYRQ